MSPALLLTALALPAAPAPDLAKQRLEAFGKRLPAVVSDWAKDPANVLNRPYQDYTFKPEVRLLRRLAPERAKATLRFAASDRKRGGRSPDYDLMVTIFLCFQDGCWTAERFEPYGRLGSADAQSMRTLF